MAFPIIGDDAPNFILLNQRKEKIDLKSFRGKNNVVVYFYPKASTPGCTTQACAIRDSNNDFGAINAAVIGISPDATLKLQKFDHKYNLGFTLLSDENHEVADLYGVWGFKKFMGKEYMGIVRTSFIIDFDGKLRHVISKVNTKTHASNVIAYMKDNF